MTGYTLEVKKFTLQPRKKTLGTGISILQACFPLLHWFVQLHLGTCVKPATNFFLLFLMKMEIKSGTLRRALTLLPTQASFGPSHQVCLLFLPWHSHDLLHLVLTSLGINRNLLPISATVSSLLPLLGWKFKRPATILGHLHTQQISKLSASFLKEIQQVLPRAITLLCAWTISESYWIEGWMANC